MSKHLILGLTAALITVLLIIVIGLFGIKVASTVLEKKVRAIHIKSDVQTLKQDVVHLDIDLPACEPVATQIQQLTALSDTMEYAPEELRQTRIKIAKTAERAAKCYKEKTWHHILDDRGLSSKKQLVALGNSVFIAGRQAGYKFSEEEKIIFDSILDLQADNLGREFIFEQADIILPQLDGMLLKINKTLADAQNKKASS